MNFLQLSSTLRITFVLVTLVRDGEELLLLRKKEIKDRARIQKSKVLSGMTRLQLYFLYLPKYTGKKNLRGYSSIYVLNMEHQFSSVVRNIFNLRDRAITKRYKQSEC